MFGLIPDCKEVTRMVSESMDRDLPLIQRMKMRMHLVMCKYCSRFEKQLALLRKAGQSLATHRTGPDASPVLPQDARDRIKQALREGSA
ncbi:MAG: zf-HC2 domain-containing protein [Thermodesulfobacteriota bacterium]